MVLNKGDKVKVRINQRDDQGKIIKNQFTWITGICYFYGKNPYLGFNQITIGRRPIYPIEEKDIKIIKQI